MEIRISADKMQIGAMYAPFCRTRAVSKDEWEKDINNISKLGFSCIHGFAEWHDIEKYKGKFDFSDVDYMVECAAKNGITAIVNIATQNGVGFYAPRWFTEEYEGDGFIDSRGGKNIRGQFVVPCIDDPLYQKYACGYLAEVAKHFAGDSRVGGFVLWGEPHIYRPGSDLAICYCEHTVAKFRLWLKERYKSIDSLNSVWSSEGPTEYESFEQVLPPTGYNRQQGGYSSWEDWREFMEQNLANHIIDANRIFKENGAMQPTITEMLTGFNNSIDSWKLAKTSDIIGISCFERPGIEVAMHMAMADSMAKALGKSTFVVESQGGPTKYRTPSVAECKSAQLQRFGYGSKGLMYWCYRPRTSDMEGNEFGMVKPNGGLLPRAVEMGKLASAFRGEAIGSTYLNSVRKSEVAVFMSQSINHIMDAEFMHEAYLDGISGAYRLFCDLHKNTDFICEAEILKDSLRKYKVLVLPCSYVVSEQAAKKIAEFTADGGVVLADYGLAEKRPGGFCYSELPGAGLNKVFGIERNDTVIIEAENQIEKNSFGIEENSFFELITQTDSKAQEKYIGQPLVTENAFGKGRAIYIATGFFASYCKKATKQMRDKIKDMLEISSPFRLLNSDNEDATPLISSVLYREDKISVITFTNTKKNFVSDTFTMPDAESFRSVDAESNVRISGDKIEMSFEAFESIALYRE